MTAWSFSVSHYQFGSQEPGTPDQSGGFCSTNPGDRELPRIDAIKWNSTRFLIGRNGKVPSAMPLLPVPGRSRTTFRTRGIIRLGEDS